MTLTLDDLNKLKDVQFEKLIKALLIPVIGNGVTPFGIGKDGAREATFSGEANYPSPTDKWKGNWIFQVKFADPAIGIGKARTQIKQQIDSELKKLEDYGYIKESKCENYIYITNIPFTGASKTGMHDHIAEKKKSFKIKNFDYWDGEKVITLLHSHPNVRETFFSVDGFSFIDELELERINKIFVKPTVYNELKAKFLKSKIVGIIGQPHVGKTALSFYLANEIKSELDLENIFLVRDIEEIPSSAKITKSVIIFDDIYGDLFYNSIGRKSKSINTLLAQENYLIVSSRDYIDQEARERGENIPQLDSEDLMIIQEGAYSDELLTEILINHLSLKLTEGSISKNLFDQISGYSPRIISQLRFPHNIQLFVQSLDGTEIKLQELLQKITESKNIEKLIIHYIKNGSHQGIVNICLLSLFRIELIAELKQAINALGYNYETEAFISSLSSWNWILEIDQTRIKFKHPSFRSAVHKYFEESEKELLLVTINKVIFEKNKLVSKKVFVPLVKKVISSFTNEQIIEIILSKKAVKKIAINLWAILFTRDQELTYQTLVKIITTTRHRGYGPERIFFGAKLTFPDKEIIKFVKLLITKRKDNLLADELIVGLAPKLARRGEEILSLLPLDSDRDILLRISLLGCIAVARPSYVETEILSFCNVKKYSRQIRKQAYKALNGFKETDLKQLIFEFPILISREPDNTLKKQLVKRLNVMKRIMPAVK